MKEAVPEDELTTWMSPYNRRREKAKLALKEAERPTNPVELGSFLGIANHSTPFIKNCSDLSAPPRELIRKGQGIGGTGRAQEFSD